MTGAGAAEAASVLLLCAGRKDNSATSAASSLCLGHDDARPGQRIAAISAETGAGVKGVWKEGELFV